MVEGLEKHSFGIFKRRWQKHDHLVIVGYNEADNSHFVFDQRQVNEQVKKLAREFLGPHSPLSRTKLLMDSIHESIWKTSEFDYIGSINTGKTSRGHRHFVLMRGSVDPLDFLWHALGFRTIIADQPLEMQVGHYHAPIIQVIIEKTRSKRVTIAA